MIRKTAILILLLNFVSTPALYAACQTCQAASSSNKNWPERTGAQFLQGCTNITMGWAKAFTEPFKECDSNPNPDTGYKAGNGVLMGWGKAVMATGAGLLEVITCVTPVRIIPDTDCAACSDVLPAVETATGPLTALQ